MERRPYAAALERLRAAGLRPTHQRLGLTRLLFAGTDRHVTAEALHKEALANNVRVSLATIYNTLIQFTEQGCCAKWSSTHLARTSTRMPATTIISSAKRIGIW